MGIKRASSCEPGVNPGGSRPEHRTEKPQQCFNLLLTILCQEERKIIISAKILDPIVSGLNNEADQETMSSEIGKKKIFFSLPSSPL